MEIWGALTSLVGAVLVVVAFGWEFIDLKVENARLIASLDARNAIAADAGAVQAEKADLRETRPLTEAEVWDFECRTQAVWERRNDLNPNEREVLGGGLVHADVQRAVVAASLTYVKHQGLIAAVGGLLAMVGAVLAVIGAVR